MVSNIYKLKTPLHRNMYCKSFVCFFNDVTRMKKIFNAGPEHQILIKTDVFCLSCYLKVESLELNQYHEFVLILKKIKCLRSQQILYFEQQLDQTVWNIIGVVKVSTVVVS